MSRVETSQDSSLKQNGGGGNAVKSQDLWIGDANSIPIAGSETGKTKTLRP